MEYKVTVHVKNPEYVSATILETTYTFFNDDGKWTVSDYDECPVDDVQAKRALKIMNAFSILA
jgi:hypothetical protein